MDTSARQKPAVNYHPDPNVQLILNAQRILHVSEKNVKIHVIQQPVVETLNAKFEITVQSALAS
jgi:hypothetical protein